MTVLQPEMLADQLIMTVARNAIKISVLVGRKNTVEAIRLAMKGASAAIRRYQRHRGTLPEEGIFTVKELQEKAGGDLHQIPVSADIEKIVTEELKERGIEFAIETAPDGNTYIHFKGSDADSMRHGIDQARTRFEKALEQQPELANAAKAPAKPEAPKGEEVPKVKEAAPKAKAAEAEGKKKRAKKRPQTRAEVKTKLENTSLKGTKPAPAPHLKGPKL